MVGYKFNYVSTYNGLTNYVMIKERLISVCRTELNHKITMLGGILLWI